MQTRVVLTENNFRTYFDRYYHVLVGFANKFVKDIDISEDLVQDIFVNLWEKHDCYENEITLKVYLYRSVRNNCLSFLKKQKVHLKYMEKTINELDREDFFLNQILSEEVTRLLYQFIQELPQKRQQIIRYSMLGLRNQDIAEIMGISVHTVKVQKMHSYKELRRKLGEHAFLIALLLNINF